MPAIYIDTLEDFLRVRGLLEPVFVTSKRRGRVLVPCANTLLVKTELVVANTWNPNSVPADKLSVLVESILDNGFCFPIVVIWNDERGHFVVIDGFHRKCVGGDEWLELDYVPVVVLTHDMARCMIATWQFNKARGHHQVDLDAELIRKLADQGVTDDEIATKLGVDLDTVHRYRQVAGVAELFARTDYSPSWSIVETGDGA